MVSALQTEFNELVTSYDIEWEDQDKIVSIIMGEQRPPLEPPNSLKIASSGDLWGQVTKLWEKLQIMGRSAKASDSATKACGQEDQAGQEPNPQVSDLPNESGTSRWQVRDSPIGSQSSEPSQQFSEPTQVSEEIPHQRLAEWEAYARKHYGPVTVPPFVLHKRGKGRERMVVIPTATGLRPDFPIRTEIVLRDWNSRFGFWTLDLNGTRHIVKAFPGASKGGVQYKRWTGPSDLEDDEWKGPVAFSDLKFDTNHTALVEEKDEEQKVPADSLESDLYCVSSSDSGSDSGTEGRTMPARSKRSSTGKESARSDTVCRVELATLRRKSGEGNHLPVAPIAVMEARSNASFASPSADCQRNKRERQATPPVPTKRRKNEIPSTPPHAQREEQPFPTQPCQTSMFKQERTTLRFYLRGSNRFHGERLRDCLTTSKVFGCITKYFNIAREDVAEVTVVFSWMDQGAEGREMAMDFGKEADMEILIEEIDNAPVWDMDRGTGRCIVNVHVCPTESL